MLKYHAVMTYTNDINSLMRSIKGVECLNPYLSLVDNSVNKPLKKMFPNLYVYETPIQYSCSQSFNYSQEIARSYNVDVLIMMHSDIEVLDQNKLFEFLNFVENHYNSKTSWGVIFTTYDSLAAFNMDTCDVIGPWDQNITHYPIDVDYYYRMRKYGFQTLDFGGDWIVHHPSATIRKNLIMDHINLIHTNHCNNVYYERKWGGSRDRESFLFPFNGQDLNKQYLQMINDPIYQKLLNSSNSTEGGFLYDQSENGRLSQFSLMLNILNAIKPKKILETGTQKYLFTYFLSNFIEGFELDTFDHSDVCLKSWEIINEKVPNVKFHCGDSRETLSEFNKDNIDLAWVDGGHDYSVCLSDIKNCIRLKIPYILVDDSRMQSVWDAIVDAIKNELYHVVKNPYWETDNRGITVLRRAR